MSKYYEAYDKRYRQVHDKGLSWSPDNNTEIVEEMIMKYHLENARMLEIGCGEGRDARYLLNKDYDVLATDISEEAIRYCKIRDPEHKISYRILDVLKDDRADDKYGFIYSIATLHMLVLDEDRNNYFNYIYKHMEDDGYALILTMGDGKTEVSSDITKAFDNVRRTHQQSEQEMDIVQTSCRMVSFDTLFKELSNKGLEEVEDGITEIENHFDKIMYVLIKKA